MRDKHNTKYRIFYAENDQTNLRRNIENNLNN